MEDNVIAVVVTYNRKELLKECLDALMAQKGAVTDVLVVDNASTDGTEVMVQEYMDGGQKASQSAESLQGDGAQTCVSETVDRIDYLRSKENIGGAGGFSLGIKAAAERGYKYIWIMDDDTIPNEDALYELMQAGKLLKGDFGYLSSQAVWTDGSACRMNAQKLYGERFIDSYQYLNDGIVPIKSASFVSLFLNADAVRAEGLPYKEYFIWGDDKEYTLRLSKSHKAYRISKSVVLHKMATNNGSNIITDECSRISRYRYAYRNDLVTARACGWQAVMNYYVVMLRTGIRIIRSDSPHKILRIRTMLTGMAEGIFFHPNIEHIAHRADHV